MKVSKRFVEKGDQLEYIAAMLTTLGDMLAATDYPLLTYFVDLAAAEAREECEESTRRRSGACWASAYSQ
ncbi:MAG: hypothetical protein ABSC22_12275 [Roseiarcus sp.]|jgi:hypothetical protein